MSEKTSTICDLCDMDGEDKEAVGWYEAIDGEIYDVCEKHIKDVKNAGLQVHLYCND